MTPIEFFVPRDIFPSVVNKATEFSISVSGLLGIEKGIDIGYVCQVNGFGGDTEQLLSVIAGIEGVVIKDGKVTKEEFENLNRGIEWFY